MNKIKSFKIDLANDCLFYRSGDTVKGMVKIKSAKETKIKSLSLVLIGLAKTNW